MSNIRKSIYDAFVSTTFNALIEFFEDKKRFAEKIESEFPPGTFIKFWTEGQEYNTMFGYIASKPVLDIDEPNMSDAELSTYGSWLRDDMSYMHFMYVPIDIYFLDIESGKTIMDYQKKVDVHKNFKIEKSSIDEYREFIIQKYTKWIDQAKENIKLRKDNIKSYKKAISNIDRDIETAENFISANFSWKQNR